MREAFATELAEIERRLIEEFSEAVRALSDVSAVVMDPGVERLQAIAQRAQAMRVASRSADADLVVVTARQAPVAGDLRLVLSLIQLARHAMLIAHQFELISDQIAEIEPGVSGGRGTAEQLCEMSTLAAGQLSGAIDAFGARDADAGRQLDRDDNELDRLNRAVFDVTLEVDDAAERELALRHVLIARSLERIGDNALDIAEQAAFLATAVLHEFTDASRPKRRRGGAEQ
jgi:phosphate transport system protein